MFTQLARRPLNEVLPSFVHFVAEVGCALMHEGIACARTFGNSCDLSRATEPR